ncbi:unnamed protein product [Gadus morhua 'NCC']
METIVRVVGTAIVCITAVFNYLTDVFLTQPLKATIQHLEETDLTTLSGENRSLKAKSLWASSGAVIMALDQLGVPLYAVVKEDVGTEVLNFQPFFNGDIFLDAKRRFYGPRERSMGLLAFLRVGVWTNGLRAFRNGFIGNVSGEGFILGGVYVLGPGEQGVILEHREIEFGDKVNVLEVLNAVGRIQRELVSLEER